MPNRKILVNDVRIRGTGTTDIEQDPILPLSNEPPQFEKARMSHANTTASYIKRETNEYLFFQQN